MSKSPRRCSSVIQIVVSQWMEPFSTVTNHRRQDVPACPLALYKKSSLVKVFVGSQSRPTPRSVSRVRKSLEPNPIFGDAGRSIKGVANMLGANKRQALGILVRRLNA